MVKFSALLLDIQLAFNGHPYTPNQEVAPKFLLQRPPLRCRSSCCKSSSKGWYWHYRNLRLKQVLSCSLLLTTLLLGSFIVPVKAQQLNFTSVQEAQDPSLNPLSTSDYPEHLWLGPNAHTVTFRGNRVSVNGISANVDVIAAWSDTQNVADNTLKLSDSAVALSTAALAQGSTLSSYNTLSIDENSSAIVALGALSLGSSTLRSNELSILGHSTYAFGAYSTQGRAQSNELNLEGSAQSDLAIGGYGYISSTNNEVFVDTDAQATTIIGGASPQGAANENFVNVSGSSHTVIGGYGLTQADSNFVDLSGEVDTALAGYSPQGSALYNSLTIWSGTVTQAMGAIASGKVANNTLTLSADAKSSSLLGGYSLHGDSIFNVVNVYGTVKDLTDNSSVDAGSSADADSPTDTDSSSPSTPSSPSNGVQVIGGIAAEGNSYLNEVNVLSGSQVIGQVIGAVAAQDATYNEVSILGSVEGEVTGALSYQGSASLNLLRVKDATIKGNLSAATGWHASNNTLLLDNAKIEGSAAAALLTNPSATETDAGHNLAIVRGTTSVTGTVYGAYATNGKALNANNEISIDGQVTVGALDGYHRLHLFLRPENDSTINPNATHVLHVTGKNGLDLRHKEVWVTGLKTSELDQHKLIYVDATDELLVDESTLIRGDETFVFNAWIPKDDHAFEHELIWVEEPSTPPTAPSDPDNSTPDGEQPELPSGGASGGSGNGAAGSGSSNTSNGGTSSGDISNSNGDSTSSSSGEEIFEHYELVDVEHASTLLVAPSAAALTLAQGSTLLDELRWPYPGAGAVQPLVAVRGFSFDCKAHGTMELDGAAALMGITWSWQDRQDQISSSAAPYAWHFAGALFLEAGEADFSQDFASVSPSGDVSYGGVGMMLHSRNGNASILSSARLGYVQSDFSGYYERTSDQVNYDYSSWYGALGLRAQYDFTLSPILCLSAQLRYDFHMLGRDTLQLEHKDQQELKIDSLNLHSFKASMQATAQLTEDLTIESSLFWRQIVASTFTGEVEGYTIPSYKLSGQSYGLNLGLSGRYQSLEYSLQARISRGDLHELSGQAQLAWLF